MAGYELLVQQYGEDPEGLCNVLDDFLAEGKRVNENYIEIRESMKQEKKAAYQEVMLEIYFEQ